MDHHPREPDHPPAGPQARKSYLSHALRVLAATVMVLIGAGLVGRAHAQMPSQQIPPCGPRVSVIEQLARDFDETPVSRGLASNGTVLEVLVSPAGTWTILISLPNGHSCFGAAGEMWEPADAKPKGRHH